CDGEVVEATDTSRILAVDLYGTLAEIVFSVGLGDHVVGRDTSTGFPEAEHLPVVTPGAHDLNAEAILALEPTVVLTDATIGPTDVQLQLRDAGIPVIFFDDTRSLDTIPTHIRAVAGALGVPDAGEELVERTFTEIREALDIAPVGAEAPSIAFLYLRGGMVQLLGGPGSGADSLIRAIGARDVGTEAGLERPFTQISAETMIDMQPDVVLLMSAGLESVGGPEGLLQVPGLAQTEAVQEGRVVDMDDTVLLSFGPRTGEVVEAMARAVYERAPRRTTRPAAPRHRAPAGAAAAGGGCSPAWPPRSSSCASSRPPGACSPSRRERSPGPCSTGSTPGWSGCSGWSGSTSTSRSSGPLRRPTRRATPRCGRSASRVSSSACSWAPRSPSPGRSCRACSATRSPSLRSSVSPQVRPSVPAWRSCSGWTSSVGGRCRSRPLPPRSAPPCSCTRCPATRAARSRSPSSSRVWR